MTFILSSKPSKEQRENLPYLLNRKKPHSILQFLYGSIKHFCKSKIRDRSDLIIIITFHILEHCASLSS